MPNVQKTVNWLNTAADHMANKQFKMMMKEAARLLMFQQKTVEAVTKANGTMAPKLAEYMEAEQQKRLYIFPCAPGDKVWVITSCLAITDFNGDTGECPFEESHDCPIHNRGECGECTRTQAVFPDTVAHLCVDTDGVVIITNHTGAFYADRIGEIVFFDKDLAEKKLGEMKNA